MCVCVCVCVHVRVRVCVWLGLYHVCSESQSDSQVLGHSLYCCIPFTAADNHLSAVSKYHLCVRVCVRACVLCVHVKYTALTNIQVNMK